jgi:hypothetical protein
MLRAAQLPVAKALSLFKHTAPVISSDCFGQVVAFKPCVAQLPCAGLPSALVHAEAVAFHVHGDFPRFHLHFFVPGAQMHFAAPNCHRHGDAPDCHCWLVLRGAISDMTEACKMGLLCGGVVTLPTMMRTC